MMFARDNIGLQPSYIKFTVYKANNVSNYERTSQLYNILSFCLTLRNSGSDKWMQDWFCVLCQM
jgi:hypothetical protein